MRLPTRAFGSAIWVDAEVYGRSTRRSRARGPLVGRKLEAETWIAATNVRRVTAEWPGGADGGQCALLRERSFGPEEGSSRF